MADARLISINSRSNELFKKENVLLPKACLMMTNRILFVLIFVIWGEHVRLNAQTRLNNATSSMNTTLSLYGRLKQMMNLLAVP